MSTYSGFRDTPSYPPILSGLALLVAVAGSAGSIWLSIGMKLQACPLCFYQRSFALGAMAVLCVGLASRLEQGVPLGLLALPLALAGLLIAIFHVRLEWTGVLECPLGILGYGSAPQQSLAFFGLLSFLLFLDAVLAPRRTLLGICCALALALALAWCCLNSNPPLAAPPEEAWSGRHVICRRPFVPPQ
jgi:disulfide bond formation protein DsbB